MLLNLSVLLSLWVFTGCSQWVEDRISAGDISDNDRKGTINYVAPSPSPEPVYRAMGDFSCNVDGIGIGSNNKVGWNILSYRCRPPQPWPKPDATIVVPDNLDLPNRQFEKEAAHLRLERSSRRIFVAPEHPQTSEGEIEFGYYSSPEKVFNTAECDAFQARLDSAFQRFFPNGAEDSSLFRCAEDRDCVLEKISKSLISEGPTCGGFAINKTAEDALARFRDDPEFRAVFAEKGDGTCPSELALNLTYSCSGTPIPVCRENRCQSETRD
jgi:hypothetical protein